MIWASAGTRNSGKPSLEKAANVGIQESRNAVISFTLRCHANLHFSHATPRRGIRGLARSQRVWRPSGQPARTPALQFWAPYEKSGLAADNPARTAILKGEHRALPTAHIHSTEQFRPIAISIPFSIATPAISSVGFRVGCHWRGGSMVAGRAHACGGTMD